MGVDVERISIACCDDFEKVLAVAVVGQAFAARLWSARLVLLFLLAVHCRLFRLLLLFLVGHNNDGPLWKHVEIVTKNRASRFPNANYHND